MDETLKSSPTGKPPIKDVNFALEAANVPVGDSTLLSKLSEMRTEFSKDLKDEDSRKQLRDALIPTLERVNHDKTVINHLTDLFNGKNLAELAEELNRFFDLAKEISETKSSTEQVFEGDLSPASYLNFIDKTALSAVAGAAGLSAIAAMFSSKGRAAAAGIGATGAIGYAVGSALLKSDTSPKISPKSRKIMKHFGFDKLKINPSYVNAIFYGFLCCRHSSRLTNKQILEFIKTDGSQNYELFIGGSAYFQPYYEKRLDEEGRAEFRRVLTTILHKLQKDTTYTFKETDCFANALFYHMNQATDISGFEREDLPESVRASKDEPDNTELEEGAPETIPNGRLFSKLEPLETLTDLASLGWTELQDRMLVDGDGVWLTCIAFDTAAKGADVTVKINEILAKQGLVTSPANSIKVIGVNADAKRFYVRLGALSAPQDTHKAAKFFNPWASILSSSAFAGEHMMVSADSRTYDYWALNPVSRIRLSMAGVTDDFSVIAKRFPIDVTKREIKGFGNFSNEAALKAVNKGLFDHLQSIVKSEPKYIENDIRFYPLIAQMLKQALSDITNVGQKMKLITEVKAQTDLLTMYKLLLDHLSSSQMQKHKESIPDGKKSAFEFVHLMKGKYGPKYEKLIWQYAHTLISKTHRGELLSIVQLRDEAQNLSDIKYPELYKLVSDKLARHIEILEMIYKNPAKMPLETRIKLAPQRFHLITQQRQAETIVESGTNVSYKRFTITQKTDTLKHLTPRSELSSGYACYDDFEGEVSGISFVYSRLK